MTWKCLRSQKRGRKKVLSRSHPVRGWRRGEAILHLTPIYAFLKSFQRASGEIPFSAKYTERCFTRGELKSCWGRKYPQSPLWHRQKLKKKKTFLPSLKLSETALVHSQCLWSNCRSQRLKQRGQALTVKELSDAKYGLSLENAGFPSDHSGCIQPEAKIWFSRLLRAKVQMAYSISCA